jgi:hypothetical protein
VYRIFNKLGVSNRVEVVMYAASQAKRDAASHGIVTADPVQRVGGCCQRLRAKSCF